MLKTQQVWLTFVTVLAHCAAGWGMMYMVFGSYNPGWTCQIQEAASNASEDLANFTLPGWQHRLSSTTLQLPPHTTTTTATDTTHHLFREATGQIWTSPGSSWNFSSTPSRELTSVSSQCEQLSRCVSPVQFTHEPSTLVSEWGLVCDRAWIPSTIISIQMAGVLLGTFVAGQAGERYGRKVSLFGNVALYTVSNLVAAFSISWHMMAALRFLVGMALGGILSLNRLYNVEFLNHKWRADVVGIPFWNFGNIGFVLVAYLLQDWAYILMMTAAVSFIAFIPVFCTPESLRWLIVNGKEKKAAAVVKMMARMNKKQTVEMDVLMNVIRQEESANVSNYTYLSLFKRRFLSRSLKLGFVWMLMGMGYYAIFFGIKALSGNFYLNLALLSLVGTLCVFLTSPMIRFVGRRWGISLLFVCTSLLCTSVVLVHFLVPGEVKGHTITGLALCASVFLGSAWNGVVVHTSELYPTVVRMLANGYAYCAARVGGIVAPFLIPKDEESVYVSYAVLVAVTLVCALITATLPETKGKPLQDTFEMEVRGPVERDRSEGNEKTVL